MKKKISLQSLGSNRNNFEQLDQPNRIYSCKNNRKQQSIKIAQTKMNFLKCDNAVQPNAQYIKNINLFIGKDEHKEILIKENIELKQKINKLEDQNVQLKARMLQFQKQQRFQENNVRQDDYNKMENTIHKLNEEVSFRIEELQALKKQSKFNQILELKIQNEELQNETKRITEKLNSYVINNQQSNDFKKIQQVNQDQQNKIIMLELQIQDMTNQKSLKQKQLIDENQRLLKQLDFCKTKICNCQNQNDSIKQELVKDDQITNDYNIVRIFKNLRYRLLLKKISLKYIDLYLFEDENMDKQSLIDNFKKRPFELSLFDSTQLGEFLDYDNQEMITQKFINYLGNYQIFDSKQENEIQLQLIQMQLQQLTPQNQDFDDKHIKQNLNQDQYDFILMKLFEETNDISKIKNQYLIIIQAILTNLFQHYKNIYKQNKIVYMKILYIQKNTMIDLYFLQKSIYCLQIYNCKQSMHLSNPSKIINSNHSLQNSVGKPYNNVNAIMSGEIDNKNQQRIVNQEMKINELLDQNRILQEKITQLQLKIHENEDSKNKQFQTQQQLHQKTQKQESQIQELSGRLDNSEQYKMQYETVFKQLKQTKLQNDQLQDKLNKLMTDQHQKETEFQEQLSQLQIELQSSKNYKLQSEKLDKQYQTLKAQCQNVSTQQQNSKVYEQQMIQQLEDYENKTLQLQDENFKLDQQLQDIQSTYGKEMQNYNKIHDNLSQQLKNHQQKNKVMQQNCEQLQNHNQKLKLKLDDKNQKNREFLEQIDMMENRIKTLLQDIEQKNIILEKQAQIIKQKSSAIDYTDKNYNQILKDVQDENLQLVSQNQLMQDQILNLQTMLEAQQKIQLETKRFEINIEDKQLNIQQYQKQIQELQMKDHQNQQLIKQLQYEKHKIQNNDVVQQGLIRENQILKQRLNTIIDDNKNLNEIINKRL